MCIIGLFNNLSPDNIMAFAAIVTSITAIFAYFLASKKFSVDKEKSDREGVSVVFKSITCIKNKLEVQFKIYNRSSVDLLIEDISLLNKPNHGWTVSIFNNAATNRDKSSERIFFTWSYDPILPKNTPIDMAFIMDSGESVTNGEFLRYPIVDPQGHLIIKAEFVRDDKNQLNMKIGKIRARLCYEGAKSREYSLLMIDGPKLQDILKRQRAIDAQEQAKHK